MLIVVCSSFSMAAGEESGFFYAGLKAGKADYGDLIFCGACDQDRSEFSKISDSPFAFGVFGGYQINTYIAAELTLIDLGSAEFHLRPSTVGPANTGPGYFETQSRSIDSSLKGILPLGDRFEVFAKLGLHYFELDAELVGTNLEAEEEISRSWNGTDLSYSLGAVFKMSPHWRIGMSYETYMAETEGLTNDTLEEDELGDYDYDLGMIALNLSYRF